jgi:hypothetical protein
METGKMANLLQRIVGSIHAKLHFLVFHFVRLRNIETLQHQRTVQRQNKVVIVGRTTNLLNYSF